MPYERLNLVDGEVLTAEHIAHIEDALEQALENGGGGESLPEAEGVEFG
jgi:hypothetical protein